jgi:hypothetical protein
MNKREIMDRIKQGIPKKPKQHGQYQMTLGSLIKALQRERVGLFITIGVSSMAPGKPHSYYGYHTDLAFEPSTEPITVAGLLKLCEDSVGKSFVMADHFEKFYKDHTMQINAPLWISTLNQASKEGIVDLVPTEGYIQLITKTIEQDVGPLKSEEEKVIDDTK